MRIKPTADRVLIEPLEAEEKTARGIIIPDIAKEKPQQGKVAAAGPDATVKTGDTVYYGKYSGTEFPYEGIKYLIMRQTDIWASL